MKIIKVLLAIIFCVTYLVLCIWSIAEPLKHGDALPLFTAIGVPIGFLLWVFIKDQDRKQEEERRKRKERKFWGDNI